MHYAIIGNGVAGVTAAFTLRSRDPQANITLISGESDYFFSRTALMYAYLDRMNPRDLEPYERSTYDRLRISRRRGWVRDLNADARLLHLESGEPVRYDKLLLTLGSTPARVPWPGLDAVREGAVHFVQLDDLAECERLTPTTKQAVVVGGGLIGVELAECLVHHGVSVDFLIRDEWYWPSALNQEEGALVERHIRRHGVNLRLREEVTRIEAGPNGRVSAAVTSQGNTLACQMLGICIGVKPAVDWLRPLPHAPAIGRGVQIASDFRTSVDGVWAAGDCAELSIDGKPVVEQIWYSAKRHGELAALSMLGDAVHYTPPLFYNSAKFFEMEYTTVGRVNNLPASARSFFHRLPGHEASVRIVAGEGGAVTGFNMLGSRWNHRVLESWIAERRTMEFAVAHLAAAQFDVEFGRAPLASIRAAFGAQSAGSTAA